MRRCRPGRSKYKSEPYIIVKEEIPILYISVTPAERHLVAEKMYLSILLLALVEQVIQLGLNIVGMRNGKNPFMRNNRFTVRCG